MSTPLLLIEKLLLSVPLNVYVIFPLMPVCVTVVTAVWFSFGVTVTADPPPSFVNVASNTSVTVTRKFLPNPLPVLSLATITTSYTLLAPES